VAHECPTCSLQDHCRQSPAHAWSEKQELAPCLPYFKELARLEMIAAEAIRPLIQGEQTDMSGCSKRP
jgi:hypothetical protein